MAEDIKNATNEEPTHKKRSKVISGKAKKKNKHLFGLFSSEDLDNIINYIYNDVLKPSVKKMVRDSICNSTDIWLYHEARGSSKGGSSISRPAYRKAFESERDRGGSRSSEVSSRSRYQNVILENRADAEEIIETMSDICEEYDCATIADLYELAELETKSTDNNYGWTKAGIKEAKIVWTIDGYLLKFPKPIVLD